VNIEVSQSGSRADTWFVLLLLLLAACLFLLLR
jgi:hypothetical protein